MKAGDRTNRNALRKAASQAIVGDDDGHRTLLSGTSGLGGEFSAIMNPVVRSKAVSPKRQIGDCEIPLTEGDQRDPLKPEVTSGGRRPARDPDAFPLKVSSSDQSSIRRKRWPYRRGIRLLHRLRRA